MKENKTAPNFSPYLFWDVKKEDFDYETNKRFMIERVCSRGTEADWKELFRHYGQTTVREEMLHLPYLDNKTLNYLSVIFQMPKSKFKCYRNKQLRPNFWSC
ncbi:hypothetical protein AGMMS49525_03550 [Bacteroidia bacterium]|nr:hypothetical protein AGMMS49525_03550 [Bacteroidia bacterium]